MQLRRIGIICSAFLLTSSGTIVSVAVESPATVTSNSPSSESSLAERFATRKMADSQPLCPSLREDVLPLLGRVGCNGRACHGSFQGQGGFRLSLFGYDFKADHDALAAGKNPRVDLAKPADSLILIKPTSAENHGGGERIKKESWQYQVLRRWD